MNGVGQVGEHRNRYIYTLRCFDGRRRKIDGMIIEFSGGRNGIDTDSTRPRRDSPGIVLDRNVSGIYLGRSDVR